MRSDAIPYQCRRDATEIIMSSMCHQRQFNQRKNKHRGAIPWSDCDVYNLSWSDHHDHISNRGYRMLGHLHPHLTMQGHFQAWKSSKEGYILSTSLVYHGTSGRAGYDGNPGSTIALVKLLAQVTRSSGNALSALLPGYQYSLCWISTYDKSKSAVQPGDYWSLTALPVLFLST